MTISAQEEKELTESRYWRPEVGKQYTVILTSWRFERRTFKEASTPQPEGEARATLVMNVLNINGERQEPMKEFSSSNKNLNKLLMPAIRNAEAARQGYIKVAISRSDLKTYSVMDLAVVEQVPRAHRAEHDATFVYP